MQAKEYSLVSPDKKTKITVTVDHDVIWTVSYNDEVLVQYGGLALELSDGTVLCKDPTVISSKQTSVNSIIEAEIPVKNRHIPEIYNQLSIRFKGNYSVTFRAYNDGVAYRIETLFPGTEITVKSETAEFSFPASFQTAWPSASMGFGGIGMESGIVRDPGFGSRNPDNGHKGGFGEAGPGEGSPGVVTGAPPREGVPGRPENTSSGDIPGLVPGNAPEGGFPGAHERSPFSGSYEYSFIDSTIASIEGIAGLPLYLSSPLGTKLVLTEADLYDYPNMFLKGTLSNTLIAAFPPAIIGEKEPGIASGGDSKPADYIARTKGARTYPWRVLIISPDDKGLLESDMVYKLSSPPSINTDWIKPGQVTWEWYNDANIFGVDFESGINTPTYKYYVDFAAEYGIEYLLIDAGWKDNTDVSVPEIIDYAKERNVGVILWVSWDDLHADLENTLNQFEKWGAKGIKMDFMNRADQDMVNLYERTAIETAKRKMLLDFHGAYKPAGLNRKYPNVVNFEGVKGMEANKMGSKDITPSHDVTLLFTRMVAGPMDYTPGATVTASFGNFKNISSEPMSQGTRAHQAAMYIMYDAPIQMLADNPTLYMKEDAFTRFLTQIPTVWDKTIGIDGKIGQYAIMARKNGDQWYIGAMTDWSERPFEISLDFLDHQKYKMEIIEDGVNANKKGIDYKLISKEIIPSGKIKISMKQGGGWAAILTPVEN